MKNFKIIFFIFLLNSTLDAVTIRLLSDKNEILAKNFSRLLVKIDENEAVYKDHILFSVDHPNVFVDNYKILIEPEDLYIHSFRQSKKIYSRTFAVDLKLQGFSKDFDQDADVVFQCLVFDSEKEKTTTKILKLNLIKAIQSDSLDKEKIPGSSLIRNKLFNFLKAKRFFMQNIKFNDYVRSLFSQVSEVFKFVPDFFLWGNYLFLLLSFCFFILSCYFFVNYNKRSIALGFLFGLFSLPLIVKFLILNFF